MKDSKKIVRRRYGAELKRQVLAEYAQPGASVASVALSHGINANVVHNCPAVFCLESQRPNRRCGWYFCRWWVRG